MRKIGYVRVSTALQNTDRQLDKIELDQVYTDKCSGKDTNRPQLRALLENIQVGDKIYVHSMDRLARNSIDLYNLVGTMNEKGASVIFVTNGNLEFSPGKENPISTLELHILGAVAQFERALLLERQKEGIAKAKARGVYKGRKPVDEAKIQKALELCKKGVSVVDAAKACGIGKSTLYKNINRNF